MNNDLSKKEDALYACPKLSEQLNVTVNRLRTAKSHRGNEL